MTLDNEPTAGDDAATTNDSTATTSDGGAAPPAKRTRRRAASRPAGPPADTEAPETPPAKKTARKRASKKATAAKTAPDAVAPDAVAAAGGPDDGSVPTQDADQAPPKKKAARKRATKKVSAPAPGQEQAAELAQATTGSATTGSATTGAPAASAGLLFQAPDLTEAAPRRRRAATRPAGQPQVSADPGQEPPAQEAATEQRPPRSRRRRLGTVVADDDEQGTPLAALDQDAGAGSADATDDRSSDRPDDSDDEDGEGGDGKRRRRRRGGRGRRKRAGDDGDQDQGDQDQGDQDQGGQGKRQGRSKGKDKGRDKDKGAGDDGAGSDGAGSDGAGSDGAGSDGAGSDGAGSDSAGSDGAGPDDDADGDGESSSTRRRRRRRRGGRGGDGEESAGADDPPNTVVKVRQPRKAEDEVTGLKGSTRLEAKRQRRREGRDSGRRKPVVTEAEFLARRESVERVMVVREREGRTQIGVLEDGVLVEHYVARKSQASMVGNVYLGKVQNVLPSMEAAFVDIGKGRNAVLYAGEVNWDAAGMQGQPRRIELALKSGDPVLVQVTKDPIGHKGARLTSQVSLAGRYLVYVPNGSMTGISRKLPDTERARLKKILKAVVPDEAGVIVRTASEGASEVELERDVARLQEQWAGIEKRSTAVSAPALLHGEPDLTVRVIRDVFNEDVVKLVVAGDEAWETVQEYVGHVAPDLADRLERYTGDVDVFTAHRVDEQIAKAVERKVWLPSGGSLVIDRTEAMTVVDVNTGKFVGSGGNLEATVTKNNLEAAEEIVRQLRLRDVGGIIVIDFIDMVLESNRDLVMRRLLECLGRDRTKHQVAEVTSLGLVQMTRKRVGQGLLDAFSEPCEHCGGRGVILHDEPVESAPGADDGGRGGRSDGRAPKGAQDAPQKPKGRGEAAKIAEAARLAAVREHPAPEPAQSEAALESVPESAPAPEPESAPPPAPEPAAAEAPVVVGEPAPEATPKRRGRRRAGSPVTTPKSAADA